MKETFDCYETFQFQADFVCHMDKSCRGWTRQPIMSLLYDLTSNLFSDALVPKLFRSVPYLYKIQRNKKLLHLILTLINDVVSSTTEVQSV